VRYIHRERAEGKRKSAAARLRNPLPEALGVDSMMGMGGGGGEGGGLIHWTSNVAMNPMSVRGENVRENFKLSGRRVGNYRNRGEEKKSAFKLIC